MRIKLVVIPGKKLSRVRRIDKKFYLWLHKSLKEYMKYAPQFVDLHKNKIMYDGAEHEQAELITQLILSIECYLDPFPLYDDVSVRIEEATRTTIMKLWAALLPYMAF